MQSSLLVWPTETISKGADGWWIGLPHHDPAILMSDTHGDSWRIATTADFVAGIPEPGAPAAAGVFALLALWVSRGARTGLTS